MNYRFIDMIYRPEYIVESGNAVRSAVVVQNIWRCINRIKKFAKYMRKDMHKNLGNIYVNSGLRANLSW